MSSIRTALIAALVSALCAASAWLVCCNAWMAIQLSFADEQTEIFSEMTGRATEALRRQPPDVKAALEFLEYIHNYYRTGTKQAHGSSLDSIVKRSRSVAESRIIEMLRDATGMDHGTDTNDWIHELRKYVGSHE